MSCFNEPGQVKSWHVCLSSKARYASCHQSCSWVQEYVKQCSGYLHSTKHTYCLSVGFHHNHMAGMSLLPQGLEDGHWQKNQLEKVGLQLDLHTGLVWPTTLLGALSKFCGRFWCFTLGKLKDYGTAFVATIPQIVQGLHEKDEGQKAMQATAPETELQQRRQAVAQRLQEIQKKTQQQKIGGNEKEPSNAERLEKLRKKREEIEGKLREKGAEKKEQHARTQLLQDAQKRGQLEKERLVKAQEDARIQAEKLKKAEEDAKIQAEKEKLEREEQRLKKAEEDAKIQAEKEKLRRMKERRGAEAEEG